MLPLLRYFAIASAVLLLLTSALVITLYRQTSLHHVVAHGEDTSAIIARSLQSSLWPEYGAFLTTSTAPSEQSWLTHPNKADLESLIGPRISGLSIHSVTIYNARGMTVFSTETFRIGRNAEAKTAVRSALSGKIASTLNKRGITSASGQTAEQVDILSTAVPILDRDGLVEAVIEVEADAGAALHHLARNTALCALVLLLVFSALYIALLAIVRRANRTAAGQHQEILTAKEALAEKNLALADEVYERKRAELALRELNDGLEARVAQRTVELHETQVDLLRKQRLASLGQLIGTVAHDLRNPLNAIRNSLSVIGDRTKQAGLDLERPLHRTERCLNRCEGIIHDLLDHTRIQNLDLRTTAIDDWLLELLDEQAPPDGILLRHALTTPGVEVELDTDRFRRVVINIIENAFQAIAENPKDGDGKGHLTVASRVLDERLEISFEDTGPGIDPDLMAKVFEPLFTTKRQGVGLGLPLVKQIVELHGGAINITSEKGEGTCITLRMPIRDAAEVAA